MNRTELEKTFKRADTLAYERMMLRIELDVSWIELTMMQRTHAHSEYLPETGLLKYKHVTKPDPLSVRITHMTGQALRHASGGDKLTQRHVAEARGLIYNGVVNLKRRALA